MRLAILIAVLAFAGCGGGAGQVELVGNTMGTQFSVKLPNGIGDHDAVKLQKVIEAALNNDESQMSTYRPDSEISRFNASS
ncbi:MAG: FAD:protein FMN transferase ApbE, partial [Woeseiaceae bacterium]|nr:FAD:protein FMN transferase ApbE [Woeseiaceae bacterium]